MPKHRSSARQTKAELIRQALNRKSGASIADLRSTTGWQAHSIRAALSGFRKVGYTIERTIPRKGGAGPIYRITGIPDTA